MREEIRKQLIGIKLSKKEMQKKFGVVVLFLAVIVVLLVLSYLYFPLNQLLKDIILVFSILSLLAIIVVVRIYYIAIPENILAFLKITRAIEILEESNTPIAYKEAYR